MLSLSRYLILIPGNFRLYSTPSFPVPHLLPEKITSSSPHFLALARRGNVTFHTRLKREKAVISYGEKWKRFPPGTEGYLYLHVPAGGASFEGSLRFRVTTRDRKRPSAFNHPLNFDLRREDGTVWAIPMLDVLSSRRYAAFKARLLSYPELGLADTDAQNSLDTAGALAASVVSQSLTGRSKPRPNQTFSLPDLRLRVFKSADDILDFSSRTWVHFLVDGNDPNVVSSLHYHWTGANRYEPFPRGSKGFLYYHEPPLDTPRMMGEIRFRLVTARYTGEVIKDWFEDGVDLLRPDGMPWSVPLWHLVQNKTYQSFLVPLLASQPSLVDPSTVEQIRRLFSSSPDSLDLLTMRMSTLMLRWNQIVLSYQEMHSGDKSTVSTSTKGKQRANSNNLDLRPQRNMPKPTRLGSTILHSLGQTFAVGLEQNSKRVWILSADEKRLVPVTIGTDFLDGLKLRAEARQEAVERNVERNGETDEGRKRKPMGAPGQHPSAIVSINYSSSRARFFFVVHSVQDRVGGVHRTWRQSDPEQAENPERMDVKAMKGNFQRSRDILRFYLLMPSIPPYIKLIE